MGIRVRCTFGGRDDRWRPPGPSFSPRCRSARLAGKRLRGAVLRRTHAGLAKLDGCSSRQLRCPRRQRRYATVPTAQANTKSTWVVKLPPSRVPLASASPDAQPAATGSTTNRPRDHGATCIPGKLVVATTTNQQGKPHDEQDEENLLLGATGHAIQRVRRLRYATGGIGQQEDCPKRQRKAHARSECCTQTRVKADAEAATTRVARSRTDRRSDGKGRDVRCQRPKQGSFDKAYDVPLRRRYGKHLRHLQARRGTLHRIRVHNISEPDWRRRPER